MVLVKSKNVELEKVGRKHQPSKRLHENGSNVTIQEPFNMTIREEKRKEEKKNRKEKRGSDAVRTARNESQVIL